MHARLEKIHVMNFKSLKDCKIELGKFNVLIGPNGSGKTNVLESFKFINRCINPVGSPPYPFTPWWGFDNIVWGRKEELSVFFSIQYSMYGTMVRHSAEISGSGGKLSFLSENHSVENLVDIIRDPSTVKYVFDKGFLDKNQKELDLSKDSEIFAPRTHAIPNDKSLLRFNSGWFTSYSANGQVCSGSFTIVENGKNTDTIPFVSPIISENDRDPVFPHVSHFLTNPRRIIFLRQLNLNAIRQPSSVGKPADLSEDGDGLINLLFAWYSQNGGRLPDRIVAALEELFPGWQVAFTVTDDGRIMLIVKDGELRLFPTSIPDGFYKLLAILAAVELDPMILLIDEVDTSLHAKIIDYLISTFKTIDSTVLVTTHSPLVIDMVDLEDLILLETSGHETRPRRIQDPNELRTRLQEKGMTPSESWIYAEL